MKKRPAVMLGGLLIAVSGAAAFAMVSLRTQEASAVSDPRNRAYFSLGCLWGMLIPLVILLAALVWVILFFFQPGWD